jgi:hypothetical protein
METHPQHVLVRTAETADYSTFACLDGCGRRLVVGHGGGSMTVVERGDPTALHRWNDLGITMGDVAIVQE